MAEAREEFMKTSFATVTAPTGGALVLGVADGGKLGATGIDTDRKVGGALKRAIKASRFTGKKGQLLSILQPKGVKADRVLLVGLGKAVDLTALAMRDVGGKVVADLLSAGDAQATAVIELPKGTKATDAVLAANFAYGARLRNYRFDKYHTKQKAEDKPRLKTFKVMTGAVAAARKAFGGLNSVADGVFSARDLVTEPANTLFPKSLAAEARKLSKLGVKVEVLGEAKMKALGMGALLGVGQGSARESQLIIMRWNGGPASQKPVALVGKGVTFDTGGISLKPGPGMEMMKFDMGGSAAVIGAMRALAGRKAKANVVGVVGAVENMPSSTAQRPGDVVTSMSGQTIEILNTDAEGRLVLADALWYTQKRFKPKVMIDLATLTGAIIMSLGYEYAGLFSNNDKLVDQLTAAGEAEGERVWRMPTHDNYDKHIKSDIADMKNTGGPGAGSISAAKFLERFVNDVPWAHLDIAAMVWPKEAAATCPRGASGYGVRILDRLIADNFEGKKS
jgi:leucyl aminopeptidase